MNIERRKNFKTNRVAVICHSARFYQDWIKINNLDSKCFQFVRDIDQTRGLCFSAQIVIGDVSKIKDLQYLMEQIRIREISFSGEFTNAQLQERERKIESICL